MRQVVIENPVLNSPCEEPKRHFKFDDEGITNEVLEERRSSAYFKPVPAPRKRGRQLPFETEWTEERIEPNLLINQIRERVAVWLKAPPACYGCRTSTITVASVVGLSLK